MSSARAKLACDLTAAACFARRQSPPPSVRPPSTFNDLVDRSGGGWACWPWMARASSQGYGQVRVREGGWPTTVGAHRVAYYLATGFWSDQRSGSRKVIRHLCHNPSCCNPRHLVAGTFRDNAWDAYMRRLGVDLVAIRIGLGEGPFLPVVGWAK